MRVTEEIRADRCFATQTIDIYYLDLTQIPGVAAEPIYRLTESQAQQLVDDLYRTGLRPSETRGTAGKLEASERHLDHVTRLLDQVLPLALKK